MMLRSRKVSNNSLPSQEGLGPTKRHGDTMNQDPKRRRGGLSDLSNMISQNLLIDSSTRKTDGKVSKTGLKERNGNVINRKMIGKAVDEKKPGSFLSASKNMFHLNRLLPLKESVHEDTEDVVEEEEEDCPDYDATVMGDMFQVGEYAQDIFQYYKFREAQFMVSDYQKKCGSSFASLRALMVDWVMDFQQEYMLLHETMHQTFKIMDLYFSKCKEKIRTETTGLITAASLLIACKFEERQAPFLDDICEAASNTFNSQDLKRMERQVLRTIEFDLGFPSAYRFLRRFARVIQLDMPSLTLARYYLEVCSLFYSFLAVSESRMAAACLLLALRTKTIGDWNGTLRKYSGYSLKDIESLMWAINHAVHVYKDVFPEADTVFNKYSSRVFFDVVSQPLIKDQYEPTDPVTPPREVSHWH